MKRRSYYSKKRTSKNNYRDLDNRDIISLLICIYNRKNWLFYERIGRIYLKVYQFLKMTDILNKKIDELELEVKRN